MKKYKWIIILVNLIFLLVYFNYSVGQKEEILKSGELVLLSLAPVDPRSLMQGDYMTLRYGISEDIPLGQMPKQGFCVVLLDSNGVAKKVRFQKGLRPLHQNEHLIAYAFSDIWTMHIGAESYFFEEGQAEKYEKAKYGGLKIDQNGNTLLIGLYDADRKKIE